MKRFNTSLIAFLLCLLFSLPINAQANDNDESITLKRHHVGLKFSLISHTGFFYGNQIDENFYISFGGFYFFESNDGNIDSIIELGAELQYSIFRANGFNFYSLAGIGFQNDKDYLTGDRRWVQYGIGLGVSSQSASGITINVDCGLLRYRRITGPNSERILVGFGLGVGLGYRF